MPRHRSSRLGGTAVLVYGGQWTGRSGRVIKANGSMVLVALCQPVETVLWDNENRPVIVRSSEIRPAICRNIPRDNLTSLERTDGELRRANGDDDERV